MVLEPQSTPAATEAKLSYDSASLLYSLAFHAMGTECRVSFPASSQSDAMAFCQEAIQWVMDFEAKYSRFRSDSLISRINRMAGLDWVEVDAEVESILLICDDLNLMTRGVLDPTMLPLVELWDFRKKRDLLPSESEIASALRLVGWSKVLRRPGEVMLPEKGMSLDLGGFGKEYAVDKVAALAVGYGFEGCLVDFGRDIHAVGTPPNWPAWHVGLENPETPGSVWSSIAAKDVGIATSGDYCRYFEYQNIRYGHIIDPRSGRPVRNEALSVTTIANSCLEAGVMSTAAFVLGPVEGFDLIEETFGVDGCFFMENGVKQSKEFLRHVVE